MSASVEVRQVSKRFGRVTALNEVSLQVRAGEFLTLLGPSGCGKTTLLRLIAGFEAPDAGTVWLEGADVTALPPNRRNVNQVFQTYALFPHLTVAENIAFGLRMQRWGSREISARVTEMVELVALEGCEARKPDQLSGGQRQRVALARALAPRPAVLLLDEPLSALDARLRQSVRLELKRLQRQVGTTFIFVTHDQEEALTMSDRIALMNGGRVEQLAEVHEIYHQPATAFAAEFLGSANLLEAEAGRRVGDDWLVRVADGLELRVAGAAWPAGATRARLAIRAEKIHVSRTPLSDENAFPARVVEEVFQGATDRLVVVTDAGVRLTVVVANESAHRTPVHAGDRVWCAVHTADIVVLP